MGPLRFELKSLAPQAIFPEGKMTIKPSDFDTYIKHRSISVCNRWLDISKTMIQHYLEFVNWTIDENKTLDYFQLLKDTSPSGHWRKKVIQIRKFLLYLKVDWANNIKVPKEFHTTIPKHISKEDIASVLSLYQNHKFFKQIKAIILLGCSSGLRAEEIYQLTPNDIDLDNRIVYVNHNPGNGQTTKTGRSRVSFFNVEAQKALIEYMDFFNNGSGLKQLFNQSHITRIFRKASIQVKDLRKFFSQEWERNCGPTGAKKLLMGHSGDVDLNHYNAQSNEDLKKIYDNIGIRIS